MPHREPSISIYLYTLQSSGQLFVGRSSTQSYPPLSFWEVYTLTSFRDVVSGNDVLTVRSCGDRSVNNLSVVRSIICQSRGQLLIIFFDCSVNHLLIVRPIVS